MRLKLNREQCEGLCLFLQTMLDLYDPADIPESLVDDFLTEIKEKLRKKVIAGYAKEWSLTLSIKEAKAYYTFFRRPQKIPVGFEYEVNLVRGHIAEIDRLYSPAVKPIAQLTSGLKQIQRHG